MIRRVVDDPRAERLRRRRLTLNFGVFESTHAATSGPATTVDEVPRVCMSPLPVALGVDGRPHDLMRSVQRDSRLLVSRKTRPSTTQSVSRSPPRSASTA
jgi:hypothetical protein